MGRLGGGVVFLLGMLLMAYNVWKTVRSAPAPVPVARPARAAA
jgi:cytochrome c oxidase cbb3-type subunit 1